MLEYIRYECIVTSDTNFNFLRLFALSVAGWRVKNSVVGAERESERAYTWPPSFGKESRVLDFAQLIRPVLMIYRDTTGRFLGIVGDIKGVNCHPHAQSRVAGKLPRSTQKSTRQWRGKSAKITKACPYGPILGQEI